MRIAIISYWNSTNNYGQVLQCFALQKCLRDMGHNAFHIKYLERPKSQAKRIQQFVLNAVRGGFFPIIRRKIAYFLSIPTNNITYKELHDLQKKEDTLHRRQFDKFRDKYLSFTKSTYDEVSIKSNPPEADCLIAGSDQIWGYPSDAYMLNFGNDSIKRIAYAPSLGGIEYKDKYLEKKFKRYLEKIDIVTCREQDGVEVCRRVGRKDTELVPDPVFLLPKETYEEIAVKPTFSGYVFLYILGNPIEIEVKHFFDWANHRNLKVIYVAAQGRSDSYPKLYPNVDEFIGLIMNAKYIFTNSYHGMAMSIILNKQFSAIPLTGNYARMNNRVTTLLSRLKLTDRILTDSNDVFNKEIDYTEINLKLSERRTEILRKFKEWLC